MFNAGGAPLHPLFREYPRVRGISRCIEPALNMNTFDYLYYPVRNGATAEFIKRHSVTPGEDVFITGLLISHPGKSRVLRSCESGISRPFLVTRSTF